MRPSTFLTRIEKEHDSENNAGHENEDNNKFD